MTEQLRFLKALRREPVDRPPFWFMRQAGRYLPEYRALRQKAGSFLELCYDSEFATEVTLQPIRRYEMDAAIIFADILLLPQALGQHLEFREGEGPVLDPVRDRHAVDRLRADYEQRLHDHLSPIYDTVRKVRAALDGSAALVGFAGAPWTVATYMVEGHGSRDFAHAKGWAYRDPEGFQALIDLLVDATAAYLCAQIDAGAQAIQIFDTWASALSEPAFERWSIAPTKALVQKLRAHAPEIPILGFPRAVGVGYQRYVVETGVDGISVDSALPLSWAREHLQPLAAVQGNLDPMALVAGGTAMLSEASRIVAELGDGPFIFNLGHGIVPQTPPEHVAALCQWLRDQRLQGQRVQGLSDVKP